MSVVVFDNLCNIAEHGLILIDALKSLKSFLVLPLEKKSPSLVIKPFDALLNSKKIVRICVNVSRPIRTTKVRTIWPCANQ